MISFHEGLPLAAALEAAVFFAVALALAAAVLVVPAFFVAAAPVVVAFLVDFALLFGLLSDEGAGAEVEVGLEATTEADICVVFGNEINGYLWGGNS